MPTLAKYFSRTEPKAVFTQKLDTSMICLLAKWLFDVDTNTISTRDCLQAFAAELGVEDAEALARGVEGP